MSKLTAYDALPFQAILIEIASKNHKTYDEIAKVINSFALSSEFDMSNNIKQGTFSFTPKTIAN